MVTFPSFGQSISADKLTVIRELMEVTGAQIDRSEFSKAFIQQMISVLRAKDPTLPDRITTIVTEEVHALVAKELDDEVLQHKIYPIYANHFTLDELKQLVEFNRSPVGQKANQVMPAWFNRACRPPSNGQHKWPRNCQIEFSKDFLMKALRLGKVPRKIND